MPPETCWGSVDAWIVDTGLAVGLRTPKNQFAFRLRLLVPAPVKPAPSALIIVTGPQPTKEFTPTTSHGSRSFPG